MGQNLITGLLEESIQRILVSVNPLAYRIALVVFNRNLAVIHEAVNYPSSSLLSDNRIHIFSVSQAALRGL